MYLLNRHFWKFFCGLLVLIALGFLVIFGMYFYSKNKIRQEQAIKQAEYDAMQKR